MELFNKDGSLKHPFMLLQQPLTITPTFNDIIHNAVRENVENCYLRYPMHRCTEFDDLVPRNGAFRIDGIGIITKPNTTINVPACRAVQVPIGSVIGGVTLVELGLSIQDHFIKTTKVKATSKGTFIICKNSDKKFYNSMMNQVNDLIKNEVDVSKVDFVELQAKLQLEFKEFLIKEASEGGIVLRVEKENKPWWKIW